MSLSTGAKKRMKLRMQEKARALFVRIPHLIRKENDVAKLFSGEFRVDLPRQASRHCFVIFPSVEEQLKNLKAASKCLINGKPVVVAPANTYEKAHKIRKNKIVIPTIQEDPKVTKALFISNIKCGTKPIQIKEAFEGCSSVKLLTPYSQDSRAAIIKMHAIHIAAEYLSKKREWPVVAGRELKVHLDTRIKHRKPKSAKKLKIYTGEPEEEPQSSKNQERKPLKHTTK